MKIISALMVSKKRLSFPLLENGKIFANVHILLTY